MPTTHADIVERLRTLFDRFQDLKVAVGPPAQRVRADDIANALWDAAEEIERLRTVALENRYIDTSRYDDPANPLGPELMDTDSTTVDHSPSPLWPGKPHD